MIKVMMVPHADTSYYNGESGIKTLVAKYFEYLPKYDIELVGPKENSFDVLAIHAGMSNNFGDGVPLVAHIHGLYWTADYPSQHWQHKANSSVIETIKLSDAVTVPSAWVAKSLQRDMHIDPYILRHGIDWWEWENDYNGDGGYVLWNKNRNSDVCSPAPVNTLALMRPNIKFLTTFADNAPTPNIKTTGVVRHEKMREYVQRAAVYLATTKETFGIGTLEAMASGVPVLGFDYGGTGQIVKHGKTGYLARPGDFDDLANGLDYCLSYREVLGKNAIADVKRNYGWASVAEELADIYNHSLFRDSSYDKVAVIIPCYNKASTLERAVESVVNQTLPADEIIIVDNNSTDNSRMVMKALSHKYENVMYTVCGKQGVAHARNYGITVSCGSYICCLDADDSIEPRFLEVCVGALRDNKRLGIAYTRLRAIDANGMQQVSAWPDAYDFNAFLQRKNQVPTCCVFRRDAFYRTGGYRQRYAPHGAGSEDAELWFRMGSLGYGGELVTEEPLFNYHLGGQVSGDPTYREVDWMAWHPWVADGKHPYGSMATPSNGVSHEVRQYDRPVVSVVIPCSSNHLEYLVDVLDSLEAQEFRKWEAIVVVDGKDDDKITAVPFSLTSAYPFVNWISLTGNHGPGRARNIGAEASEAPLLLFMDADDWLTPNALEEMLRAYESNPDSIIYTDYYAHSTITNPSDVKRLEITGRLMHYDDATKEAITYHKAFDYNCERAQAQPGRGDMYIWNLISSLVPAKFHRAIGGFDESMKEAWEDWDYWLRMSHRGYCFTRLAQPLIEYRFATGTRRAAANPNESGESGRQLGHNLIEYLSKKYEGVEKMGCGGCRKHRATPVRSPVVPLANTLNNGAMREMNSSELVWVELIDGNIGGHPISFGGENYGYRSHGERFKMFVGHARLDKRVMIVEPDTAPPVVAEETEAEETPPPEEDYADWEKDEIVGGEEVVEDEFDNAGMYVEYEDESSEEDVAPEDDSSLVDLWGINEVRAKMLKRQGINTAADVVDIGIEGLTEILGLKESIAKRIISEIESMQGVDSSS